MTLEVMKSRKKSRHKNSVTRNLRKEQRVKGGGGEDASLGETHRRLPLTYEQVKQENTLPQFLFPVQQCFL